MIKTVANIKCTIKEFDSNWFIDHNTPLEVAKEILFFYLKTIGQIEDQKETKEAMQKMTDEAAKNNPTSENTTKVDPTPK